MISNLKSKFDVLLHFLDVFFFIIHTDCIHIGESSIIRFQAIINFHCVIPSALPKAPGTPVVTERTATSITLTWDSGNPEPVSYYIIQVSDSHTYFLHL